MIFAPFVIANDGQIQAVNAGAVESFIGPQGYVGEAPLVSETAPAVSDSRVGGFSYSATGALRVKDATAGLPAGSFTVDGLAVTAIGQLCVILDDVGGGGFTVAGVAVSADGRVYMAPFDPPPAESFLLISAGNYLLINNGGNRILLS